MKIKRNVKAEKVKTSKKAMDDLAKRQQEVEKTLLEEIEEELEDDGIVLFTNENVDEDYLTLPKDITEVESKELGKYFNAFTQQRMWTRTLLGRVSTTIRSMKMSLDDIKFDVFSRLPAKMTVKEKELHFSNDFRARETIEELVRYEEKYNLLSDYLQNLEDGIFNISREITRRSGDFHNTVREDNINNIRRRK